MRCRLGRLSVERLIFVAPMPELRRYLDRSAGSLGLGRRARRRPGHDPGLGHSRLLGDRDVHDEVVGFLRA